MNLEQIARKGLEYLLAQGATDGACSVYRGTKTEFCYTSGTLDLLRTVDNVAVSFKALVGTKKGTASLNSLEDSDLRRAAKDAVSSAKISKEDPAEGLPDQIVQKSFSAGPLTPDKEEMLRLFDGFFAELNEKYPQISVDSAAIDHSVGESVFCTTDGICLTQKQGFYSFSPMFMARDGENTSSFHYFGAQFCDLDRPLMDLAGGRQVVEDTLLQINPVSMEGKFEGEVIFTPSCFGDLLGSVEGNFLSDGALIDGTSIWKDKLGKPVAAPCFQWSCRPRSEELAGGCFVTGGYEAKDSDLIKDGVLQDFVLSRYGAKKTGLSRNPSGGGFYFVDAGDKSLNDMISTVKHGLLVGRFSGGSPAGDGTFSGIAKNSFEIRDGKITNAVSETMISGNLAQMLLDITEISAERINDGTCVLPWVKVKNLVISGQ